MDFESHFEEIICPECNSIETAEVIHTWPWASFVHQCKNCDYIIMESEWEQKAQVSDTKSK